MQPLVHIGYHKAASSWLQKHVFPNPSCGFLLPFGHRDDIEKDWVFPHPFDFSASDVLAKYQPEFERLYKEEIVPAVSHERLSGNPHSGGYDSKEIADRLHQTMPSAKILIIIREQLAMIKSCYRQYLKEGGSCSIRDYLQPPVRGKGRIPLFNFDYFKYHRLVDYYFSLYGVENVLVLPHEMLLSDGPGFVTKIIKFAGASGIENITDELPFSMNVNAAKSPVYLNLSKAVHRSFTRDTLDPKVLIKSRTLRMFGLNMAENVSKLAPRFLESRIEKKWSGCVSSIAGDRFADSNRKLQSQTGLDLLSFGYLT